MGQTRNRKYDRYTLAYKLQAVKLSNHPGVKATAVAESLGIHVVVLYRWQTEHRRGELGANIQLKVEKRSPKRRPDRADPLIEKQEELDIALKRIKLPERELASSQNELDLLKKAERFFAEKRRKASSK